MTLSENNETPLTFSVILNTCDRCGPLRTVLYALNHQTYPHFEVIVVLGPTKDNSLDMLQEEFADQVRIVRCPRFNLSVSRNMGLTAAAGDIVAFVDDDAVPCPTWLEQLATAYNSDPQVMGAGGRTYQVHPHTGDLQFLGGMFSAVAEQEDVRLKPTIPPYSDTPVQFWFPRLMGTNMSYRRQALLALNGFDEHFEYLFDDADMGVRFGLNGYQIKHLWEGVVYHVPASSRNRQIFTWDINWYTWLKCTVYFALKNGPQAVGRVKSVLKAIDHTRSFHTRVNNLHREGAFSDDLYKKVRRQLLQGWWWGFKHGLFLPRAIPPKIEPTQEALKPFLKTESKRYPVFSPFGVSIKNKVKPMSQEPLRICLLSNGYPPSSTHGVARSTHMLAMGLSELGHDVHVITQGQSHKTTYYDGAYVHQIRGDTILRYRSYLEKGYPNLYWWLNYSHAAFEAVKSLQINHNIQIVDTPLWQIEGLVTGVSKTIPLVVRVVTAMKQIADVNQQVNLDNQLLGDLETKLLEMSNGIVSNTTGTAQTLKRVYQIEPTGQNHRIIPYGIKPSPDSDIFPLNGKNKDEFNILFVGRLEQRKGIQDLFEAIPLVLDAFPNSRISIVGGDNSQEDGFQATYKMDYPTYFAKKYSKYKNKVNFLGFVEDAQLPDLYKSCDLFVAPSLYESFGLIYVEAMNYLRPTVGCNVGGPTDIIADGETGLLVPPQSPAELAEAMVCLLENPKMRREMGLAGRERFLNNFTHLKMAEGFLDFYRAVIEQ